MINEVSPAGKADHDEQIDNTKKITELSEDMEMVSPGAMLREARKALSLSQDHIANKLNLKVTLVQNIENDIFDPSMPVTFNRGYLSNYAKLVAVDIEDVLASYDALDAASIQRSEMLSFSKETFKQAEHSRVMWLSYLIVAVLIGLTVLWWQQESSQQEVSSVVTNTEQQEKTVVAPQSSSIEESTLAQERAPVQEQVLTGNVIEEAVKESVTDNTEQVNTTEPVIPVKNSTILDNSASANSQAEVIEEPLTEAAGMSTAVFTFKGDCWVNIFDATGERIAWGVKKSGYVMSIQGKAPLRITVGKPELTSIVFNGQDVDMSPFNVGNIAKFNLPIIVD